MRLAGDIFRRKAPVEISSQLLNPMHAPAIPQGILMEDGRRVSPGPPRFGQAMHEYMQAGGQV